MFAYVRMVAQQQGQIAKEITLKFAGLVSTLIYYRTIIVSASVLAKMVFQLLLALLRALNVAFPATKVII